MNNYLINLGLSRLESWAIVWGVALLARSNQPVTRRMALVRHDRILRGRQERNP